MNVYLKRKLRSHRSLRLYIGSGNIFVMYHRLYSSILRTSILAFLLVAGLAAMSQTEVPDVISGGPLSKGSWLLFNSGGSLTSIQENWGLNL
ncbi:hypothetical protein DDR33_20120 [Pararcticibacter amylolyticus]|uniref:Uncharacterized protein n=1 Tax=Pararcticibacter amylolyticus TaxID=2173175 RepID=A0A2U2PCW2_9SPHI|nr:hypothetical protein DDR33_20120 [Pararcticibacter amylolyticus]